jgi:predicted enzyme related to lactoylglutathione lyase
VPVPGARIRTVIVNSTDVDRLSVFWAGVLGVERGEVDAEAGIVWLRPDTPGGVNMGFQRVERRIGRHSEVHVDVAVDDLDEAEARIEGLGGRLVRRNRLANGFEWRVLADPDGNELCIFVEH